MGFASSTFKLLTAALPHWHATPETLSGTRTVRLDATGCTILPGFVDVHIHGGQGHDAMDATHEALAEMARFLAGCGTTAFMPTTMTAPHHEICAAVANVASHTTARNAQTPMEGARILGVHVEGPYISSKFPGAQPASAIRPPNLAEFRELLAAGPVRMITLAPEVHGAHELIHEALAHDVTVVVGHTNATYDECEAAIALGATQSTHTYNAMSGLHHRRPGTLGAVLSNDCVYAQLIADNIHVHPAAINILARNKGIDRTVLITDAMRATGLPEGEYDLGGQAVTVQDGACRLADGTLAGSILTMDRALVNFMAATGLSLSDAWPATSRTPAQSIGLAHEIGNIAVNFRADLVLLDDKQTVVATIIDGQVAYLRDEWRLRS